MTHVIQSWLQSFKACIFISPLASTGASRSGCSTELLPYAMVAAYEHAPCDISQHLACADVMNAHLVGEKCRPHGILSWSLQVSILGIGMTLATTGQFLRERLFKIVCYSIQLKSAWIPDWNNTACVLLLRQVFALTQALSTRCLPWGTYFKWKCTLSAQSMYHDMQARVRIEGSMGPAFATTMGWKQGCPLSPTLLNVFADRHFFYVRNRGPSIGVCALVMNNTGHCSSMLMTFGWALSPQLIETTCGQRCMLLMLFQGW